MNVLLTREDYQMLKGLKDDRNILVMKLDKGYGIVPDSRDDYDTKIYNNQADISKLARFDFYNSDFKARIETLKPEQILNVSLLIIMTKAFYQINAPLTLFY